MILSGVQPDRITVDTPRKTLISINMKVAKDLDVHVDESALKKADEVY